MSTQNCGLRVLCIDGGLANSISSLCILSEFLFRVGHHQQLGAPLPAYKFFDVIAGSGTGALIAILLGRLKMSTEKVITFLQRLCQESLKPNMEMRHERLDRIFQRLVASETGRKDSYMISQSSSNCKTIAIASDMNHISRALPVLFRSYIPSRNELPNCTVWEAARAVTSSPNDPFIFAYASLADASICCPNPILPILREVNTELPGCPIELFLSLGIECPSSPITHELRGFNSRTIAFECARVAREFEYSADREVLGNAYFRFDVPEAPDEAFGMMVETTSMYLRGSEIDRRMEQMVAQVMRRTRRTSMEEHQLFHYHDPTPSTCRRCRPVVVPEAFHPRRVHRQMHPPTAW